MTLISFPRPVCLILACWTRAEDIATIAANRKAVLPVPDCNQGSLDYEVHELNIKALSTAFSWHMDRSNRTIQQTNDAIRRCTRHAVSHGILDIHVNGRRETFPASDTAQISWADTAGNFPLWTWSRHSITKISVCYNPPGEAVAQKRSSQSPAMERLDDSSATACSKPQLLWVLLFETQ